MDFLVECALFLRLTGCDLGEYGMYMVATSGVRAATTEIDLDEFAERMGGSGEAALMLDFIQEAKLPFPASARSLIDWRARNSDFTLPTWFENVVASSDPEEAEALLRSEAKKLERASTKLQSRFDRLKANGAKPSAWYPIKVELRERAAMIQAIELVGRLVANQAGTATGARNVYALPEVSPVADEKGTRRQRPDRMTLELEAAFSSVGRDATPSMVMRWLSEQAGLAGSCVSQATDCGVIWIDGAGGVQKLTLKALKQRLYRKRPSKVTLR